LPAPALADKCGQRLASDRTLTPCQVCRAGVYVERDGFDTNASVDAISGMAGAADGIAAVENRTLAGKIIVYPMLHDVGLIPLTQLHRHFPTVAEKLDDGKWTREAERELLRVAGGNG